VFGDTSIMFDIDIESSGENKLRVQIFNSYNQDKTIPDYEIDFSFLEEHNTLLFKPNSESHYGSDFMLATRGKLFEELFYLSI
jgi:hypothetical protein